MASPALQLHTPNRPREKGLCPRLGATSRWSVPSRAAWTGCTAPLHRTAQARTALCSHVTRPAWPLEQVLAHSPAIDKASKRIAQARRREPAIPLQRTGGGEAVGMVAVLVEGVGGVGVKGCCANRGDARLAPARGDACRACRVLRSRGLVGSGDGDPAGRVQIPLTFCFQSARRGQTELHHARLPRAVCDAGQFLNHAVCCGTIFRNWRGPLALRHPVG